MSESESSRVSSISKLEGYRYLPQSQNKNKKIKVEKIKKEKRTRNRYYVYLRLSMFESFASYRHAAYLMDIWILFFAIAGGYDKPRHAYDLYYYLERLHDYYYNNICTNRTSEQNCWYYSTRPDTHHTLCLLVHLNSTWQFAYLSLSHTISIR